MSGLYYRPSLTMDPEERLEDACLLKALWDTFEDGLTVLKPDDKIPGDGLFYGRTRENEFRVKTLLTQGQDPRYWLNPGFLSGISRPLFVGDLDGCVDAGDALLKEGKSLFLKSTTTKHFTKRLDTGVGVQKGLGDMVWSFIDRPECLIVQEAIDMRFERRCLFMNGKLITDSPVASHLTPLTRAYNPEIQNYHFDIPGSRACSYDPDLAQGMRDFAQSIAEKSGIPHLCIDVCVVGDSLKSPKFEVIEFNDMSPGNIGLFACDPFEIAHATWKAMSPEIRSAVIEKKETEKQRRYDESQQSYEDEFGM